MLKFGPNAPMGIQGSLHNQLIVHYNEQHSPSRVPVAVSKNKLEITKSSLPFATCLHLEGVLHPEGEPPSHLPSSTHSPP